MEGIRFQIKSLVLASAFFALGASLAVYPPSVEAQTLTDKLKVLFHY